MNTKYLQLGVGILRGLILVIGLSLSGCPAPPAPSPMPTPATVDMIEVPVFVLAYGDPGNLLERTREIITYLNDGATWRGDGKPYAQWKIYNDTVYIAKDMAMPPTIGGKADYWSIYHKSVVLTNTTATTPCAASRRFR